jgi:GNAT superfamily N-acetyltransferase
MMRYPFRSAGVGDVALIARHRHEMFKESGRTDEMLAPMTEAFAAWLTPRLASGDYLGWFAVADGCEAAGIGMMVIDWPPHPAHPMQARRGYLLNVYVEPEHRGLGLARGLMDMALDEARRRGIDHMVLHATAMGRPMYERLGWRQGPEMTLSLRGV